MIKILIISLVQINNNKKIYINKTFYYTFFEMNLKFYSNKQIKKNMRIIIFKNLPKDKNRKYIRTVANSAKISISKISLKLKSAYETCRYLYRPW